MSDEPNQPSPPPPPPDEIPLMPPTLKRRYKKAEPAPPAEAADDPDNEIIVLSSLLQNMKARKQGMEGSATEGEVRAKINRFVPRGTPPGGAPLPPAPPTAPAPPPIQDPAAAEPSAPAGAAPIRPEGKGPAEMAAIAFPKFGTHVYQAEPAGDGWQRSGSTWGRGILYFAFAAALALLAFLVGRGDGTRPPAAPTAAPVGDSAPFAAWSNASTEQLDHALAADRAGDLTGARQIASGLQKEMGANPVLDTYLATLDTRLGRSNDVEATLARHIGPNAFPATAAIYNAAQGFNYTRRRDFDHAVDCFTEVARFQPFNVENLAHLAEAQRRAGRLAEAVGTFQRAIQRLPVGPVDADDRRDYLAYKERLSQVEIGQEADFKAEMDQRLAAPMVCPYWRLTAAALALQKNELTAAAAALQQAQAALPPARFAALLDDYFFRTFIHHPEIAPFLPPSSAERQNARRVSMEYFIDP